MALGNNLKKKKLIPAENDQERERDVSPDKPQPKAKAKSSKKPADKKKQIAKKKTLIGKPTVVPEMIEIIPELPVIKDQGGEEMTPTASEQVSKKEKSSTAPIVGKKSKRKNTSEEKGKGNNPLIPYYIAQELYVKKTELRKRYKEEITRLKGKSIQFVVCEIGGELYAIDIDVIKEVVPMPNLSKTPNTVSHIKGIANVRGSTYTVFDLSVKFNVVGDEIPRYLLIIDSKKIEAGITLGKLPVTLKTKGDNISNSLNLIEDASLDVSFIKGLIQNDDKLIYYLDIIELLSNDKAIVIPDKLMKEGA